MPLLSRYADLNPTAPLPEGQVWAVMIRPIATTNTEEAGVEFYKLPVSLSHHAWTSQRDFQESWLSVAIGAVAASGDVDSESSNRPRPLLLNDSRRKLWNVFGGDSGDLERRRCRYSS
ncbi:hypothetical protein HII31_00537 [Pseudocercospora fuligena]|uniref:Uncharacterized protein n=1 Tax=Pseudocercospora fuligena TaxID=685502 RepID=A0A8H6RTL7_9PEZI|nr:hypothetical protein HII31_00537 [Pseudocercospora fuligena]